MESFRSRTFFLMLVSTYSSFIQSVVYSVFPPVLPYYLRTIYANDHSENISHTSSELMKNQISETIGIVFGCGSTVQLACSLCIGFMMQKFTIRVNLLIGAVLNASSVALAFFATDVVIMCVSSAAISAGQLVTSTAYYFILSKRAGDEKRHTRFVGCFNIALGFGKIVSYIAASVSYQFLGHYLTFGVLFLFNVLDVLLRCILKDIIPTQVVANGVLAPVPENADNTRQRSVGSKWLEYLTNPFVVLVNMQYFMIYVTVTVLYGTAPNFVATELGAQQWQAGVMMGIGSTIDLLLTFLVTVFITSHRRRCVMLFVIYIWAATGYVAYPFCETVWQSIAPDAMLRTTKDVAVLLLVTLSSYIIQSERVGDDKIGYSVLSITCSVACVLGFFSSGIMVVMVTFRWLFVAMGVAMAIASLSVLPYFKLRDTQARALDGSKLSVGLELGASKLSLRNPDISRPESV